MEDWDKGYIAKMQSLIDSMKAELESAEEGAWASSEHAKGEAEALNNAIEWCHDEIVAKGGEPK